MKRPIHRIIRFFIVGCANASIGLSILNLLYYQFHLGKIVANIIATSCALIFSFILNRNFVFSDKSQRVHKQAVPFVLVTISGSLVILNLVYILTLHLINDHELLIINLVKTVSGIRLGKSFVDINYAFCTIV